jgi:hypothetical protein
MSALSIPPTASFISPSGIINEMLGFLKGRGEHLLTIVLASLLAKFIVLAFVYSSVSTDLLSQLSTKWDSAFYVDIAKSGYPTGILNGNYAFAPLYPAFIRLANFVAGNYLLAAAVVANIFSVLAALAFYYVAQIYFSPRESLYASLAFTLFPTFVTYGLVSYSEPVSLFFVMLAVYFFLKGRYLPTGIFTSLSLLARYTNLLVPVLFLAIIVLRVTFRRLKHSQSTLEDLGAPRTRLKDPHAKDLVWLLLPFLVFGLWMYLLDVNSGHAYSIFAAQAPWGTALVNPIAQFQSFFTGVFSTEGNPFTMLLERYAYTLPFFALAYPLWKVDKELTFYSSAFMLFTLSLVGTAYASGPRLMLSAWPLMLVFGGVKREYLVPILILFLLLSLQSTYAHLTSFWT